MKYSTVIVDDEAEARTLLSLYVSKNPQLRLSGSCKNGKEALTVIRNERPDIVFMDINMPEMSGLQVLERCKDVPTYFILVTAYDQYALTAFEKNAIDYVLKPYTEERIFDAVAKAITILQKDQLAEMGLRYEQLLAAFAQETKEKETKNYLQRIAVKSIGKTLFVDVHEVFYILAADQYVEVITLDKKYTVRESMDYLEEVLDPRLFFRTQRSVIVNMTQVKGMEVVDKNSSLVLLKNNVKVKLSNLRKTAFRKAMNT